MEVGEATQDERRLVGVLAIVHRSVETLINGNVLHTGQDSLQRYATLDAGERSAGAGVHAASEGDLFADILAIEPEFVWTLEPVGIAVGGRRRDHHDGARGDVDSSQTRRLSRQSEFGLDGALHAQRLLDEDRDDAGILAQRLL